MAQANQEGASMQQRNCSDADPELFYDPDEECMEATDRHGRPQWSKEQHAINADRRRRGQLVCVGCPIRMECIMDGLYEEFGIWGGTLPADRGKLRSGLPLRSQRIAPKSNNRAEAVELFQEGRSTSEVAEIMGVRVATVHDYITDHVAITSPVFTDHPFGPFLVNVAQASDAA
jgi:WhiB family redox-sensing transcriptional regulator